MANAPQWNDIESALDAVLERPVGERAALLDRIGTQDPHLRAEVESILTYATGEDALLDHPATLCIAHDGPEASAEGEYAVGERIGAYRIVGLIGRGGMGEVYRAERADGAYSQQVALKLIRRDAVAHVNRFEAERQILANLNHPAIARLLDGGVTASGRLFMVMELVDGQQIIDWCTEHRADLTLRLRLFTEVCDAVAFAHRHLVVHRDLKPGNVLVTAAGAPKLLDFGAAKFIGPGATDQTQHSPLTPGYASPEQLSGGAITTATDVYALGLLLFELLTDRRPWEPEHLSLADAVNSVMAKEAPLPSQTAARSPSAPVPARLLTGDLDAIVGKALRKEPEKRYSSVEALREDLERSQTSRPVTARAGRAGYVLGRALHRHKLLAASTGAIVLALSLGAAGMAWQAERARARAVEATTVKNFLIDIFRSNAVDNPDGAAARQTTALQLLDKGAKAIGNRLTEAPEARAELLDTLSDLYDQLEEFDRVAALERTRLADIERIEGDRPSSQRALALAELGRALSMTGQYSAAQPVLARALSDMDHIGEDHSAARVQALTTLGLVDYHVKSSADPTAGDHTAQALALLNRYNPDSPDRLTATQLLARIVDRRHDVAGAERGYRDFLALTETPPFKNEMVAHGCALDDLGAFLVAHQRYGEGLALLHQAVAVLDRAEGPDQLDAAEAHRHLALALAEAGLLREAEPALRDTLRSIEHGLGSGAPTETTRIRLDLANFELARGGWPQAQILLERNLALLASGDIGLVSVHAMTFSQYARVLLLQEEPLKAEAAIAASQRLLDPAADVRSATWAMNRVLRADLAAQRQQYEAAAADYAAVVHDWPATRDELPEAYLMATIGQVNLELARHSVSTALALADGLLTRIEDLPEQQYRSDAKARALLALGSAQLAASDIAAARDTLTRVVAQRARFDSAESVPLAFARALLAETLRRDQASAQARRLDAQAVPILKRYPGMRAALRSIGVQGWQPAHTRMTAG